MATRIAELLQLNCAKRWVWRVLLLLGWIGLTRCAVKDNRGWSQAVWCVCMYGCLCCVITMVERVCPPGGGWVGGRVVDDDSVCTASRCLR